jgi:hypothetical protein
MSIQDSDIEGMRAQISGTPNFSSIIQYTRLTQLKVHLEFLLDTTTFQILTVYVEGGYRAIVRDADADPKIVGAINYSPDNYPSARETLQALLGRTGSMVLIKLRKDEFKDVDPESSLLKKTDDFLKVISRKDNFSQIPSSGLSQGSTVVPTRGAFGAGANTTLFGEYKASQGLVPGPGQASTTVPTGGHFGATSSGDAFGNNSTGHASVGQYPPNITVTLNFNGFPASVNNKDEPENGLSGHFALRPKNANNDGPHAAAVSLYQTMPNPRSMFPDSSHETNNQASITTGGDIFAASALDATPHVFGSGPAFQAVMADPAKYAYLDVPGGRFGATPKPASALANATTTLPSDHPSPPSHLDPKVNSFVSHLSSDAFGSKTSTPPTGAFANTTHPSPFGDSQVPHGSYRYNPTTGTLKATEKAFPEATVTSASKETPDRKTPESNSLNGNTNKKIRHFATVEDETSDNFSASTTNLSETAGSMFKESIQTETQLPPPRVSMSGNTPASTLIPGHETMFASAMATADAVESEGLTFAPVAGSPMNPAAPAFPSVSGFASAPVSKFATGTVPAKNAEPVRKTVEVEGPIQQAPFPKNPAQKVPFPAQKKTASKKEGLFESMYAK